MKEGEARTRDIDELVRRSIRTGLIFSVVVTLVGGGIMWHTMDQAQEWFQTGQYWWLGIMVFLSIILPWLGISGFRQHLSWKHNLLAHTVFQCPAYGTPEQVRNALQVALNTRNPLQVGSSEITDYWMLTVNSWDVEALYLPTVAWFYKQVTEHKKYGVTTDITYAFNLWTTDGKLVSKSGVPEYEVNRLIDLISERAPAAICGYSDEAKELWEKDRLAFLKAIEHRRELLREEARQSRTAREL